MKRREFPSPGKHWRSVFPWQGWTRRLLLPLTTGAHGWFIDPHRRVATTCDMGFLSAASNLLISGPGLTLAI